MKAFWRLSLLTLGWLAANEGLRAQSAGSSTAPADAASSVDVRKELAELLLLDARHPRSVRFNLGILQNSLYSISGSVPGTYANEAERLTSRAHERLTYDSIDEIFSSGLHNFLEDLLDTCRIIGAEITQTYLYYAVVA